MTLLLPILAFVFASLIIAVLGMRLAANRGSEMDRRLAEVVGGRDQVAEGPKFVALQAAVKRVGSKVPVSPSEVGKVRLRLIQAGFRGAEALPLFVGLRMAVALGAFVLFATPLILRPNVSIGSGRVAARLPAAGHRPGPDGQEASAQDPARPGRRPGPDGRQRRGRSGPGSGHLARRRRTEFAHPDLANELRLVNIELRAGKARTDALRNLADRTGLDDLVSLTTMLIQTDKFGTSVAQSLRVFSETLRTKRRQRAEEAAAKTGVKMVFPLVFCIFPAIWVVAIGPAAIKFVQVIFPIAQNIKQH